jgi:hypothetical protein
MTLSDVAAWANLLLFPALGYIIALERRLVRLETRLEDLLTRLEQRS